MKLPLSGNHQSVDEPPPKRDESSSEYTGDELPVDYAAHAKSMGIDSITVKTKQRLEKAVAQAQIDSAEAQQESQIAANRNLANQQKDLSIKLQAAASDMEAIIAQNNAKVADYQAQVQSYQAQVNDQVQEYQVNLEKELGLFNTKRNTELQKHQYDIQDELNEFQKELAIYQADLQQKIEI